MAREPTKSAAATTGYTSSSRAQQELVYVLFSITNIIVVINRVFPMMLARCSLLAARCLVLAMVVVQLSGCTVFGPREEWYGFGFDLHYDDQHAAVLNYKLWASSRVLDSVPQSYINKGTKFYFEESGGPNVRPDYLYVKWIDTQTGKIYEDTVDLRRRLPRDLEGVHMYFMIRGDKLLVFLAFKDLLPKGATPIGASLYRDYVNVQIYPDKVNK